ncbi:MAG: ATP-binding protein, partial [Dehalococcoidia bacterium]
MVALLGRPPFVGRARELSDLGAGLDAACRGEGAVLLLAGEPGIGKTRLPEELAARAQERGLRVLWGRCYEGEGAPAFWPWIQILRAALQDPEIAPLLPALGPAAADIAQLLPELQPNGTDPPPTPSDPAQARFRLFESITSFLTRVASAQPAMLVLDDLHWADHPSLLLLCYLARATRNVPLLIAGTYRDTEVDRRHPLAGTLADLARESHVGRIVLDRLSTEDATRLIALTAGPSLPEAAHTAIARTTEGNPFFLAETVRLLISDPNPPLRGHGTDVGTAIPQSVRDVIGRRLDRLSPRCNQTLTIAAVIGRDFSLDALERVGEPAGDPLLEVLEEAEASRLIVAAPDGADRFRFTHALIRETLYDELPAARRIRLHRQVGTALETLEARDPGPYLAELAHHFTQAAAVGEAGRAVAYSRRAGDHALTVFAYEQAASHYERALRVLDAHPTDDLE